MKRDFGHDDSRRDVLLDRGIMPMLVNSGVSMLIIERLAVCKYSETGIYDPKGFFFGKRRLFEMIGYALSEQAFGVLQILTKDTWEKLQIEVKLYLLIQLDLLSKRNKGRFRSFKGIPLFLKRHKVRYLNKRLTDISFVREANRSIRSMWKKSGIDYKLGKSKYKDNLIFKVTERASIRSRHAEMADSLPRLTPPGIVEHVRKHGLQRSPLVTGDISPLAKQLGMLASSPIISGSSPLSREELALLEPFVPIRLENNLSLKVGTSRPAEYHINDISKKDLEKKPRPGLNRNSTIPAHFPVGFKEDTLPDAVIRKLVDPTLIACKKRWIQKEFGISDTLNQDFVGALKACAALSPDLVQGISALYRILVVKISDRDFTRSLLLGYLGKYIHENVEVSPTSLERAVIVATITMWVNSSPLKEYLLLPDQPDLFWLREKLRNNRSLPGDPISLRYYRGTRENPILIGSSE